MGVLEVAPALVDVVFAFVRSFFEKFGCFVGRLTRTGGVFLAESKGAEQQATQAQKPGFAKHSGHGSGLGHLEFSFAVGNEGGNRAVPGDVDHGPAHVQNAVHRKDQGDPSWV